LPKYVLEEASRCGHARPSSAMLQRLLATRLNASEDGRQRPGRIG